MYNVYLLLVHNRNGTDSDHLFGHLRSFLVISVPQAPFPVQNLSLTSFETRFGEGNTADCAMKLEYF